MFVRDISHLHRLPHRSRVAGPPTILGADRLPLGAQIGLDARLVVVALLGSAVLGIVLAAPIAWLDLQGAPAAVLRAESRGSTVGRTTQRVRHGFLIAQIALAFVLLAGAGLLAVSFKKVMEVSPGFVVDRFSPGSLRCPRRAIPAISSGPRSHTA